MADIRPSPRPPALRVLAIPLLAAVTAADRAKFPTFGKDMIVANASELQLLVNGRHSALDIKKMLDAQHERRSSLQAVVNSLEILRLAGLVEW